MDKMDKLNLKQLFDLGSSKKILSFKDYERLQNKRKRYLTIFHKLL
jgi:hypothetical protein